MNTTADIIRENINLLEQHPCGDLTITWDMMKDISFTDIYIISEYFNRIKLDKTCVSKVYIAMRSSHDIDYYEIKIYRGFTRETNMLILLNAVCFGDKYVLKFDYQQYLNDENYITGYDLEPYQNFEEFLSEAWNFVIENNLLMTNFTKGLAKLIIKKEENMDLINNYFNPTSTKSARNV
jgi:hypothetical protein